MQRSGERCLEVERRVAIKLDQEPADVGTSQPHVEQTDQEDDGRQPHGQRRQPLDHADTGPGADTSEAQRRQAHQGQPEGVDQQRGEPTLRPAEGSPAQIEQHRTAQQQRTDDPELDLFDP